MQKLYHGTLTKNLASIRAQGLVPKIGSTTAGYHKNAVDLVYAVDEGRKARLVNIITQQLMNSCLIRWSPDYQFDDFKSDLIGSDKFTFYPGVIFHPLQPSEHPPGAEPGDWYSCEPVKIEGEIVGDEMLGWFELTESNFTHDYQALLRQRFIEIA
jgi:hypothetical protein